MLLGHLDVVEARREDWTRDPFTLIEENGYFYARGASDDKAMAAIQAKYRGRRLTEADVLAQTAERRAVAVQYPTPRATFDDLMKLDNKAIQLVLKEVANDSLIIALKGAEPELREKIFSNMSSRASETLREDLESKGPVRVSEVEAEQKEVLKLVRRLSDDGQIVIAGGADESFV